MGKIIGIYRITNLINGKSYIGSSIDVYFRLKTHKYRLNNQSHENSFLQRAWNKYTESNFEFVVIEECSFIVMYDKEQAWVDSYYKKEGIYNLDLKIKKTDSEIRRLNISKGLKKCMGGKNNPRYKFLSDKETNLVIKIYKSGVPIQDNDAYMGYGHSVVMRILKENNIKIRKQGEIFIGKRGVAAKEVLQYSKDGKFIKKWECINEAAKAIKINHMTIINQCKGRRKTTHKFQWRYV